VVPVSLTDRLFDSARALLGSVRQDGWGNILTGLGMSDRDKRLGASVLPTPHLGEQELSELFAGDPLAKRIAHLPAREMTRRWISVSMGDNPDQAKKLLQALEVLAAQSKLAEAITWGRLYGGGLVFVGADDGLSPEKPLNEKAIKSIRFLTVLDRYDVQVERRKEDALSSGYGEPEVYRIITDYGATASPQGRLIHASRVLRFDGPVTPRRRRLQNEGWNDSVFDALAATLRDFWSGFDGAAALMQDFGQGVFKIKGLASLVGTPQEANIIKRFQIVDMCRSILRSVVVDADGEDFERKPTPVAGLADLLDRLEQLIAGATEIPVTLLMGRSPAGMNATGDADIRFFYDRVSSEQETYLRPPLERLLRLVMLAKKGPTAGAEPADWSFTFNPLWQPTEKEKAEVRKLHAEADEKDIGNQVLHPTEVRQSRYGGDRYSTEITLDPEFDDLDAMMEGRTPEVVPEGGGGDEFEDEAEDDAGA
jgi:phage-related protein (TIGR01555 family)